MCIVAMDYDVLDSDLYHKDMQEVRASMSGEAIKNRMWDCLFEINWVLCLIDSLKFRIETGRGVRMRS